ncbi:Ti-type conjugative transfer relaxase TraA [Rhizobium sp. YTU87027]|uniref:Ti-type conjugative transfer relaxase TraA n=1 Tax=Rhizobium sp. YTU87027 TaxID=3417741 RepID=UPI003D68C176
MAIYHLSVKPITRASGRSAVAAAAYRSGTKLENQSDGLVHDFSRRAGIVHAEIVLPAGVSADWASDRSALWNAAEAVESRRDARVAREFEIALPHELSAEQRLVLTRAFAQALADRYQTAVDFAIHEPHQASDIRNHHAHVMMTTRKVGPGGLGAKTEIERANKELSAAGLPTSTMQLREIRRSFEQMMNMHLARAGFDIRVDHRSHQERGLEIEPTQHVGVHATQIGREGGDVSRSRMDEAAARRNAATIRNRPEQVLELITQEKSVFDRRDIARTLHRYINDDAQTFQNAFARIMASPALVTLQPERMSGSDGPEYARYSTREMIGLEASMAGHAQTMSKRLRYGVDRRHVERAINDQDRALRAAAGSRSGSDERAGEAGTSSQRAARLSDEQRAAIHHITGPEQIAAVVGFAGAGKSTMLAAARQAWEGQGYTVHGAALSGKAAEGLEESSGIRSRTLASWEFGWKNDNGRLGRRDVLVIDEAGMVGSRQLARFVEEAERSGAKFVLLGDHEQLQAIGAGAPFRAIAERIGFAGLSDIRRQREPWQRAASVDFATHKTIDGLDAYASHGAIKFADSREATRRMLVEDYFADRVERPGGTRIVIAHRRADVRALNADIRSRLQELGALAKGGEGESRTGGEVLFETRDGPRTFVPGDRVLFLQNDRELGVKNGMLGTVLAAENNWLQVKLDGRAKGRDGKGRVEFWTPRYNAIDHGYATTIHKTQGATVDRTFVLASPTMDRHLTYVAMTRHREGAALYASHEEFGDRQAGRLVAHGRAPYEHDPTKRGSYYVTLESRTGQRYTVWGVDLERAIESAAPSIGTKIQLEFRGSETVRLPDGREARRNSWAVKSGDAAAYAQLQARLSRSGVKETTLDYIRDFGGRRGIGEQLAVGSEIEIGHSLASATVEKPLEWRATSRDFSSAWIKSEASTEQGSVVNANRSSTDQIASAEIRRERNGDGDIRPEGERVNDGRRRGTFSGLRLSSASQPTHARAAQPTPGCEALAALSPFEQAVDRYARALMSAMRSQDRELPILPSQKAELQAAGAHLEKTQPGSVALMISAVQHDGGAQHAMIERSGRERVVEVIAGMAREQAMQADPQARADRLMNSWRLLQAQRQELAAERGDAAREKIEQEMRLLRREINRDPAVASIIRDRANNVGLEHHHDHRSTAGDTEQKRERERGSEFER